jgi:hypothetical protein
MPDPMCWATVKALSPTAGFCYYARPVFLNLAAPMEVNHIRRAIEDLDQRSEALRRFL